MDDRHFITGDCKSHASHLPDEQFTIVLDNVVRGSADIVLINKKGEMLIGKRTTYPHPDWWIIGGKWIPCDPPELSATRKLMDELGIEVHPSLLEFLNCYSFVWDRRAAAPQDHGCHDLSWMMYYFITAQEIDQISLNKKHFSELKWIRPEEIVVNETYHPALRRISRDVFDKVIAQK